MGRNKTSKYLFGLLSLGVIILTTQVETRAQTAPTPSPTPTLEREFFKNVVSDQKAIWTAPLHLQRHDLKWAIPSGIGFMALTTTDRITGDEMAEFDRQQTVSKIVSHAGSVYGVGAISGAFYLLGRAKNNDRARETGLLSAEALVNSMIVVSALKGVSQRARPLAGRERSEFFDGGDSFPSGHSTYAWALATIIANEYQDRRSIQILAYGTAAAVSAARFTGNKHYLSDIVAGSALGYFIGKYVYTAHHRKPVDLTSEDGPAEHSRWLAIEPRFNRAASAYGLSVRWSF